MVTPGEVLGWMPLIGIGAGLFLLPGLALRSILAIGASPHDPGLGAPDRALGILLDGLGLSLALWPLLLLYGTLLGLPFTPLTVALILAGSALILLGLGIRYQVSEDSIRHLKLETQNSTRFTWPLALLTGLALVVRFATVRYLAVPNFGDSLHHTLITQLFLEKGGVPRDYLPYEPVYSFTYHFGFHALAALWAWLAGQPAWSAVISVGQVLNALAVPAAYVLTRALFRSRAAALGSAVVVGFLSGMPAQYVNWGRYTQLAGQVLLPFALAWFLRWVEAPGGGRAAAPRLALAAVGAAGLGLTHYRILIFYAGFVAIYLAVTGAHLAWRGRLRAAGGRLLGRAAAVGLLGGVLYTPWMGSLLADYLPGLFTRLGQVTTQYLDEYSAGAFLTQYLGAALPLLAVVGGLAVAVGGPGRAQRLGAVLLLWTGLLVLATRPDLLRLPGAGALNSFTVGIALYLPLGTLAGVGLAGPLRIVGRARRGRGGWGAGQAVPGALAVGGALVLAVANPGIRTLDLALAYVTPNDLTALLWVRDHTPPGAQFLISADSTFQGHAITARDAGMWLPLLAGGGRTVSVPPLSTGSEGRQAGDLAPRTQALYAASLAPAAPASLDALRAAGIAYVFLGEQTANPRTAAVLADAADYCLLYRQGRSYIVGVRWADARPCGDGPNPQPFP